MKKTLVIALSATMLLAGCSSTGGGSSTPASTAGTTPETTPAAKDIELKVMMFEGGFGSDWVKKSAEAYTKLHPNVKIAVQASPDIHQQLQPLFLSGNAPDLFNPGAKFDIMGLVDSGRVQELDTYLEQPAYGSNDKWIDTFEPTQFNLKKDGKVVGIPTIFSSGYTWWYDQKLFDDNGWTAPTTWAELQDLSAKAKAKGIAVFAFPGKVPAYSFYGSFLPLVERIGGKKSILDAFNLEDGAWSNEAFLKAAEETVKMVNDGLYLEGSASLTHTEVQTMFFQRKALFATAGTWLEGEMKDVIPNDFVLTALNQPAWTKGGAEQTLAPVSTGWGGAWYVSKESRNLEATIDFLKFLSSKEQVSEMVKTRGLASVVKGTDEAITSKPLKTALKMMQNAEGSYAPTAINDAYPELTTNIINKYQSLLIGKTTPKEFVEYAESKAKEVKKNDSIQKKVFQ